MSFVYRCSKCRARNVFKHEIEWYRRPKKCKACGYKTFYLDKERTNRGACSCEGYPYKHRPGSRCCDLNTKHPLHRAARAGATEEDLMDIAISMAWDGEGGRITTKDEGCPF